MINQDFGVERKRLVIKKIIKYVLLLILVLIIALVAQNEYMAFRYQKVFDEDRLSKEDQNELLEINRLKSLIGTDLWPGFSDHEIPILFFNEKYEFVYSENEHDFSMKQIDQELPGYLYRREAENSQAFAVNVNDQWVGSIGNLESMNKEYFLGVRSQFPPGLRSLFPYQFARIKRDMHVSGAMHELFHAYQVIRNEDKFMKADQMTKEVHYTYDDQSINESWNQEGIYLRKALNASSDEDIKKYVHQFLEERDERRKNLSQSFINLEKNFEWLEGTAKYVEIRSYELAITVNDSPYRIKYEDDISYWDMEFKRLNDLGSADDYRFYISGMVQARILDKLEVDWKDRAMENDIYLEDLLREAIK